MKVLEHLDDMDVPYDLNPRIVRGLDYYTHTAFEYTIADDIGVEKQQSALGGGAATTASSSFSVADPHLPLALPADSSAPSCS